jgi:hypothetical protein
MVRPRFRLEEKRPVKMFRRLRGLPCVTALGVLLVLGRFAQAQPPPAQGTPNASGGETIIIPESSIEHPGDVGIRSHTNIGIAVPVGGMPKQEPSAKNPQVNQTSKEKVKCRMKSKKEDGDS